MERAVRAKGRAKNIRRGEYEGTIVPISDITHYFYSG